MEDYYLLRSWRQPLLFPLSFLLLAGTTLAYNQISCCEIGKQKSGLLDPVPPNLNCAQTYDPSKTPSPNAFVGFNFCKTECPGIGLSQPKEPGQWAAPIVQFILPSVIFSMTIPRAKQVDFDFIGRFNQSWKHIPISLFRQLWAVVLLLIDTTLWIGAIIIWAAPMMVSGLYEGLLDHRVLGWLENQEQGHADKDPLEFLVTVVCGNIRLKHDMGRHSDIESTRSDNANLLHRQKDHPLEELTSELSKATQHERQEKLRDIMGSQMSFGSIVGAPVLFYLGAFVYTILDLRNDPSDQDAAISLAFGVEWMIIPHVAIIAGCLLASNNPSTATAILGNPPDASSRGRHCKWTGWGNTNETRYLTAYMWNRGQNKMQWIKACNKWNGDSHCRQHFNISVWEWTLYNTLPTFLLISLPAFAGGAVAYGTPPIGLGCRSLTFMVYAISQVLLALGAVNETRVQHNAPRAIPLAKNGLMSHLMVALKSCLGFISFVSAIGGTLMQIVGVFRNCICYVNAQHWLHIRSEGKINVASDTSEQRNSSENWIIMGSAATGFMALCCYLGWWYTRLIRQRFRMEVQRVRSVELTVRTGALEEST